MIDHVALYVEDLERAKHFFETYFKGQAGCKYHNAKTGFTSYFLSFEDGTRLELMNVPASKQCENHVRTIGYAHIAFDVGSKEAVDALTERFKEDHFTVVSGPRTTGDGYYESCIIDAEGNYIEITG